MTIKAKQEKTILYGRKCNKCGNRSHKGAFYSRIHWYCTVCKPIDDYAPEVSEEDKEKLKIQQLRDKEYKKQLRMYMLQIPKELVYEKL